MFHEGGMPGVMYGPGVSQLGALSAVKAEDLVRAARLYARIVLEACGVCG